MKHRHPIYTLKPTDTLESLTALFNVDEAVWKRYHNNQCPLDDIIRESKIPKHLKIIYLLPQLWDKEYEFNINKNVEGIIEKQKVGFGFNNSIYIHKIPFYRLYRLKIEYPKTNSSINYEVEAEKLYKTHDSILIKFTKKNFFINGFEPDFVMDEIAVKTISGIYPIDLQINYLKGYQTIVNTPEILKSWEQTKRNIKKDYSGNIIDNYLDRTEQMLKSEQNTYQLVNNDVFFALFTHRIYAIYTPNLEIESIMRVPVGGVNSALNFKGKQKIEETYNNMNGVYVHFKGYANTIDRVSKNNVNFELNVKYNLEYKTFSIKDIIAEIVRKEDKKQETVMKASIYQLRKQEREQ